MLAERDIQNFLSEGSRSSGGWSLNTKIRYERAVRLLITDIVDIPHMDSSTFDNWLNKRGWASPTIWVNFSGCKNYLFWKYGSGHPALRLKIRRHASGPQRSLELNQVIDLLASFDTTTALGIRNLAICALFLDSGLRVSELCRLSIRQINLKQLNLKVVVKGGDPKSAVFSQLTAQYITWWVDLRSKYVKKNVDVLFVGIGGSTPGHRMTRSGIQTLMRRWIKSISSIDQLSPHDLRRTFATIATTLGAPERVVMEAGRWSSTEMVKKYTANLRQREFLKYSPVTAAMTISQVSANETT